jgi:chemosensory pili system protein ChpA (sensor histidine kinase/response regulator)
MNAAQSGNPIAMVIEDDEKLSMIYIQAMKLADYHTLPFRDGQDAMESLEEVVPAVVVLDLNLPRISGETILRKIRGDERYTKTKIIITTANAALGSVLEEQSDLVLVKPVSFSQLRNLAERLRMVIDQ